MNTADLRYRFNVDHIDRNGDAMVEIVWARNWDEALAVFVRRDGWPPARGICVQPEWDAVMLSNGAVFGRKEWEQAVPQAAQ